MPEGPEVHTIADWLTQEILNLTLIDFGYDEKSRYNKAGLPQEEQLKQRLPLQVVDIAAKGKKIILMLEDEETFLVSSLMMSGRWVWNESPHTNLWLDLEDREGQVWRLFFEDSRHFGTLELFFSQESLLARLKEIGPDLISDEVTKEEWLTKIRSSRIKNKKVGLFLMEQKYFSGVGNYLRAEILYAARLSPHRTLSSLSQEEIYLLLTVTKEIIREAYQAKGATLATYLNPFGGRGGFQVKIYNQTHDPFGNPVQAEDIGDRRTTHWVPTLQH